MNIFFLSMDPEKLAYMYCDQHVIKILLEICQMMYTSWFYSNEIEYVEKNAPYTLNNKRRGYRPCHKNHPMTLWISSSYENYKFAGEIGMLLALEYKKKPSKFELRESKTSYYPITDFKSGLTRIPACMPDKYKVSSIIESYKLYYSGEKTVFARYTRI